MADWTSCAAASILRSSTNCSVMLVAPRELVEVIESRPGTVENWRSRIVATDAAMVSGLAPGRVACTCRVGKSILGRSLTGSIRYPAMPAMIMAVMTSAVMTGRLMKSAVRFKRGIPKV